MASFNIVGHLPAQCQLLFTTSIRPIPRFCNLLEAHRAPLQYIAALAGAGNLLSKTPLAAAMAFRPWSTVSEATATDPDQLSNSSEPSESTRPSFTGFLDHTRFTTFIDPDPDGLLKQTKTEMTVAGLLLRRSRMYSCETFGCAEPSFYHIHRPEKKLLTRGQHSLATLTSKSEPLTVLIMAPNPSDAAQLQLRKESIELLREVGESKLGSRWEIIRSHNTRLSKITSELHQYTPHILHITGHGGHSSLSFENEEGKVVLIDKKAFGELLGMFPTLQLLILNVCHGSNQAQAIADCVGHVIGLEGTVLDRDGRAFTRGFYRAYCSGKSLAQSRKIAQGVVNLTSASFRALLFSKPPNTDKSKKRTNEDMNSVGDPVSPLIETRIRKRPRRIP